MNCYFNRSYLIKRYAGIVLVMFVVSLLNMSVQMPAHAAMQAMNHQGMDMTDASEVMDHSAMQGMDMQDCDCPSALCESVDAQHDQLNQPPPSIAILDLFAFHPSFVGIPVDIQRQLAGVSFKYHDWQYRQHTPPPLSLTTTLLI